MKIILSTLVIDASFAVSFTIAKELLAIAGMPKREIEKACESMAKEFVEFEDIRMQHYSIEKQDSDFVVWVSDEMLLKNVELYSKMYKPFYPLLRAAVPLFHAIKGMVMMLKPMFGTVKSELRQFNKEHEALIREMEAPLGGYSDEQKAEYATQQAEAAEFDAYIASKEDEPEGKVVHVRTVTTEGGKTGKPVFTTELRK